MHKIFGLMLVAALLLLGGGPQALAAFGDHQAPPHVLKDPLTARGRFQPSSVEAGGTAELIIELTLAKSFHAYADRFKVSIETPDDFKVDQYRVAPLVPFKDAVSKSLKDGVEGAATLKAVVEIPGGSAPGARDVQVRIAYQACTSQYCLLPKTLALTVPIAVRGAAVAAVSPAQAASSKASLASTDTSGDTMGNTSGDRLRGALAKGLLPAFLLMFVAGFLTSLTPCIYPMIPITLAVLGVRAPRGGQKPSVWRSFSIAVVYVLGLAVTYSVLGVIAASTGGLFGAALSNPYVISVIAVIFAAMGVGMFGLFEVQAPAFIRNRLGGPGAGGGGYLGAFTTGLVAGIIASPCIGPVLVSVLAFIAQSQNILLGFGLLFTFALGMGMIFIVLGLSSNLLGLLPKAGGWMDGVKYLFGAIMIAMAFYYVQPIYPKWIFATLLGTTLLLLASFFGAFDALASDAPHGPRVRKGAMLALFLFGTLLATFALLGRFGLIPNTGLPSAMPSSSATSTAAAPLDWKTYSPEAFAAAVKSGKPVLIDFMAEWCGACKELEDQTYPKVLPQLNKFVLFKVDATDTTPAIDAATAKFGIVGLPTLVFFDSKGGALPDLTLTGFEDAAAFETRLNKAAP